MPVPPYVAGSVLTAAQLNTGAWRVATASAAGTATTLTVNDCFTSGYRNYRIYISATAATAGNLTLQLTAAGVANTADYYWNQVVRNYNGANTETNSGGATTSFLTGLLVVSATDAKSTIVLDVLDPQLARCTGFFSMNAYNNVSARSVMGAHQKDSAFDGFKLTAAGNITASISIYGLVGA